MYKEIKLRGLALLLSLLSVSLGYTQNVITTAAPFLTISPDARAAGMADTGAATSPDVNSSYWNPAKIVFIEKESGASISYTPWLGKILNDMWLFYGTGYYKITREQAISVSMRYFNLGDITFRDEFGKITGEHRPSEYAIDASYSRMLTENFSLGVTARYINSNLLGGNSSSLDQDTRPGRSVAVDLGAYYDKDLALFGKNANLALGIGMSNIGRKITYTDENNRDFIPTNLKLGTALTTNIDPFNSITIAVDVNKLMVPTPNPTDTTYNPTLLKGMFSSFGDAPGGFDEELKEYIISVGAEYWYNDTFAFRVGYFNESKDKGDRKYLTAGLGFRYQVFGVDFAYLLPKERSHPLAETVRFTLIFDFNSSQQEESIVE
ncbi:MAG: type IX secretion system outer membrane channel protein PorV [Cyclobacteriaceae bacterium]|nr:type IX secretion system outer membrane channel protein PorV [Cyclobacteriaceae bacterium]